MHINYYLVLEAPAARPGHWRHAFFRLPDFPAMQAARDALAGQGDFTSARAIVADLLHADPVDDDTGATIDHPSTPDTCNIVITHTYTETRAMGHDARVLFADCDACISDIWY